MALKPHRPRSRSRRRAPRLPAAERRAQLLQAALVVVSTGGYRGLTMEAVAGEAGVTKPVVYDAFANRDAVMTALLEAERHRAVTEILAAIGPVPQTLPPADVTPLVVAATRRVLEVIAARPAAYRLILLHVEGTPAAVREAIDAGRATVVERIRQLLERAVGAGTVDTELLALSIVGVGEHAAVLMLNDPERFGVERFASTLAQLVPRAAPDAGAESLSE